MRSKYSIYEKILNRFRKNVAVFYGTGLVRFYFIYFCRHGSIARFYYMNTKWQLTKIKTSIAKQRRGRMPGTVVYLKEKYLKEKSQSIAK